MGTAFVCFSRANGSGDNLILQLGLIAVCVLGVTYAVVEWFVRPKLISTSEGRFICYATLLPLGLAQGDDHYATSKVTIFGRLWFTASTVEWRLTGNGAGSKIQALNWLYEDILSFTVIRIANVTPLGYIKIVTTSGRVYEMRIFNPKAIRQQWERRPVGSDVRLSVDPESEAD